MAETLHNKILFINLKHDGMVGYRMMIVTDKNFTKKDAFDWAEEKAEEVEGIVTNFKII